MTIMLPSTDFLPGTKFFPVSPHTKRPAIIGWQAAATSDPAQHAAWAEQFAGCGWAIACAESGLIGVEIDPKARKIVKDKDSEQAGHERAEQAWRDMWASHGDVAPWPPHTRSPSGGSHFIFRARPGIDVKTLRQGGLVKLPGWHQNVIETRVNGYLLIPPSEFNGRVYTRPDGGPSGPYDAPMWLIDLMMRKTSTQPGEAPAPIVKPGSYDLRQLAKYICKVHHRVGMPRDVWMATIFSLVAQYGRYVAWQIAHAIHDGEPNTSDQIDDLVGRARETFQPGDSSLNTLFKHARDNGIPDGVQLSLAAMFGHAAEQLDINQILKEIDMEELKSVEAPPTAPGLPAGARSMIGGQRPQIVAPEYGETEIADRFVNTYGAYLSYIKSRKQWLYWDGKRWHVDQTGYVSDLAAKHCRAEATLAANTPRYTEATVRSICSDRIRKAVLSLASDDQRIASLADDWDRDPWLLGTPGGIVDLRTKTLRDARPEDRVTKSTSVAPGGACPTWLAFVARATEGNAELQAYLQRFCGYTLTGDTSEESLHFNHGPGGGGKGTFSHAVEGILGDYHTSTAIATLTEAKHDRHPTELAALQGARLVTCSETERGKHWAESRIKELTGRDKITARFMHGDFFSYLPTFKILVSGNHKPHLRPDSAMRRRFQLIPFTAKIPASEKDTNLGSKLRAEWPGILAWMIAGCAMWQRDGLAPPPIVLAATDEYMEEEAEDCLVAWLAECCVADPKAETPSSILYPVYKNYAERSSEKPMSNVEFGKELRRLEYRVERSKRGAFVLGLKLAPPPLPPVPPPPY